MKQNVTFILLIIAILAAISPAWADDSPAGSIAEGLVAYWPMDAMAGERIADIAGGAHGLAGIELTGSDAKLPGGVDQSCTISLWFRPRRLTGRAVLFGYGTKIQGQARGLWLPSDQQLSFFHWGGPDVAVDVGTFKTGRWYHAAGVYDAPVGRMRLYLDGKKIGDLPGRPDTKPGRRFHMGLNLTGEFPYTGDLDEVAVHNRVLSETEIAWLYNGGNGRPLTDIPEDSPAATTTDSPVPSTDPISIAKFSLGPTVSTGRIAGHVGMHAVRFGEPVALQGDTFRGTLVKHLMFREIVFAVRQADTDGHWYANFGYNVVDPNRKYYHEGGALQKLDLLTGEVITLIDDPKGGVRDPQMHYDGRKILFSYRKGDSPYYHLYEIDTDGSDLRQLTDGPFDDFEPAYLPDGGIVFCSSRCRRWVPCYVTQVAVLYRCDGDGSNIRQLSANTEHENTPWVLPDGRILYQRWEYVDRSQVGYHHLWTMAPDGSAQMIYYGNQNPNTVMIDAKPIPGTRKVVASFSPGHGRNEHAGFLTVVDPSAGPDNPRMARRIHGDASFRDPYPLADGLYLAARGREMTLVDDGGNVAALYNLPPRFQTGRMLLHEPRSVRPRPRERVIDIPRHIDTSAAGLPTGRAVLSNIYHGRNMQGVKRGEIKKLLVLEILPKPCNMFSGMEPLTYGGTFLLERILGTVPVEADGSAYMEIPAMRPIFFVALDENGLAVKRMQSFLTVQPGESVGCIGCHEQRQTAPPPPGAVAALQRPPSRIDPIADVPDIIDFPRDIQPILDRHCTACHDYDKTARGGPMAGGIILSGDRGPMYSHSYYMLTIAAEFSYGRNLRRSNYPPRSIGSSASRIIERLDGTHHDVKLTEAEKQTIRLWIDTAAVYAGTYAALGTGSIGHFSGGTGRNPTRPDLAWESTRAASKVLTGRCASCHGSALPEAASDNKGRVGWAEGWINALTSGESQRLNPNFRYNRHLLYNLSRPEKSLLLLAPLAKSAGGYGTCAASRRPAQQGNTFADKNDPDYITLLRSIEDASAYLRKIARFDMPSFRPREEYLREMTRYGIFDPAADNGGPIDPYKLERKYWDTILAQPGD